MPKGLICSSSVPTIIRDATPLQSCILPYSPTLDRTHMLHRICPTCQSENETAAFFCVACGASVSHVEPSERKQVDDAQLHPKTSAQIAGQRSTINCRECGLEQDPTDRCVRCDSELALPSSWFAIWPWGEETQIGEEMLIGRETSPEWLRRRLNQLGLDNVSRQHARITVQDSAAFVTDLGSSNGTFLNGEPMVAQAETPITGDGELRFGASLRVTLSRRSKG